MERLFDLDAQLLHDVVFMGTAVFLLFILLSYLLFNPVRKVLEERKEKIRSDKETAAKEKEDALVLKAEYDDRIKVIEKEAEVIMAEARKKAQQNEARIIEEAKQEALRIKERADAEIDLERRRALDDMKQEIISVAAVMAEKVVAASVDIQIQDQLVEDTLKEMGEQTWLN